MNKELREDLEHLIICKDKTITQDLRDDVKMTLDYIDELESKHNNLKEIIINVFKKLEKEYNMSFVYLKSEIKIADVLYINKLEGDSILHCAIYDYNGSLKELMIEKNKRTIKRGEDNDSK